MADLVIQGFLRARLRRASGDQELARLHAMELVQSGPDVILASPRPSAVTDMQAATEREVAARAGTNAEATREPRMPFGVMVFGVVAFGAEALWLGLWSHGHVSDRCWGSRTDAPRSLHPPATEIVFGADDPIGCDALEGPVRIRHIAVRILSAQPATTVVSPRILQRGDISAG
jgi:hypothetical protein